jgi:sulfonate transport system permease protein
VSREEAAATFPAARAVSAGTAARPRTASARTRPARSFLDTPWAGLLVPALLLLAWEVAARLALVPPNWLPAPTVVARTIARLAASGELLAHAAVSVGRVALGFAVGAAAATVLGCITGHQRRVHRLVDPTLQALRAIPSMAWAPLFLLWFGIYESSKTALIALGAFFPVYLNLASGIRAIDPKLVEVGRVFRLSGLALVRRVLLPATLPAYITGLRSGLGLAWMFVVAAEIMGASRGLGFLMVDGQTTSRPELIVSAILLFALFGKLTDAALERAGRRFLRWQRA